MNRRPIRPPRDELERAAHDLVGGAGGEAAFETLARNAALSEQQIAMGRASAFEGVGKIDAHVVVRAMPVDVVRSLLPLGLELAPQPATFPDKHPVVFLFADHFFQAWFGDMDYFECVVAVPYVRLEDSHAANRGPFLYMPRLYLDKTAPRLLGNLLYGFEKVEAKVEAGPGRFRATDPDSDEPIVSAKFTAAGDPVRPQEHANFESVRRLLEQPTISQALRIVDSDAFSERDFLSPFLCTQVKYDFTDPTSTIQPVRANVWLSPLTTPKGLPVGTFDTPSLDEDELGSFRMRAPQVVSLPRGSADARFEPTPTHKRKVVVLGGGPSGLVAAYYLARQSDRFEVELYTQGWRLGGKCAASRNTDRANRIEEHGLHAFLGFYENAIRGVRDAHDTADLPLDTDEGPLTAVFRGVDRVGVMDRWKGEWHYFPTPVAYNGKVPGLVPAAGLDDPPNLGRALSDAMGHIARDTATLLGADSEAAAEADRELAAHHDEAHASAIERFFDRTTAPLRMAVQRVRAFVEEFAAEQIVQEIEEGSAVFAGIAWLLDVVRATLKKVFARKIEDDRHHWFVWSGLDTVLTIVIGVIESKTVDFDELDRYDFREWLLLHGLDPRNANVSAITQVYETLFAHFEDQAIPGKLAAGVGLRWYILVGFLHRGYPAYDFRGACPESLVAPYYLALLRLGVKVHFFHRVAQLHVDGSGDDRKLAAIRFDLQATVKDGSHEYQPFLPGLAGRFAWPLQPNYEQLEEGETLRKRGIDLENTWAPWEPVGSKTLTLGRDFDECVLAIPLPALPPIATDLLDPASPSYTEPWAKMVDGMKVTRTISAQLWWTAPLEDLFSFPLGLMTGYASPQPSLGDFTHLLDVEDWGDSPDAPRFCAYHTGARFAMTIADATKDQRPDFPAARLAEWRRDFADWLREHYRGLYDAAPTRHEDLLGLLAAPQGTEGVDRLAAQYFHASVQPSDLYVLSQPGSTELRLAPHQSWVKHLVLCGDWTRTDINAGCVEAATQSGMLAARALSNEPTYIWHMGF